MTKNCRIISNGQLDKLYEIRDYFLEQQREGNELMIMGADEVNRHYLDICDELLDALDPSSDFNTNTQNEAVE